MKAGPKAAVSPEPLPWSPTSVGAARFAECCETYIVTPKVSGALSPMKLRPWQLDLAGSVLDATPHCWMDDAARSGQEHVRRRTGPL